MRRIYLEIYLSVVGTALLVTLGLSIFGLWYFQGRIESENARLQATGRAIVAALPSEGSRDETERVLRQHASRDGVAVRLWDSHGALQATAGPPPHLRSRDARFGPRRPRSRRAHAPWAWTSVESRDGGLLELAWASKRHPPRRRLWAMLAFFLGAVALGAYPVSRRIARGLEKLREGVAELGEGDLSTRVEIVGRNEVADVARAFNAAAEKIERGVVAQRRMLASASHELRSPLGRLRVAVELLAAGQRERLPEAERNIEELDALIDDLLLAARLEVAPPAPRRDPVDLLAIVREEADRVGAELAGEAPPLLADARLLRRLVRNLLENAQRHGAPPIEIQVETDEAHERVTIRVSDAGPGVPPEARERIFEAFYRPAGQAEGHDRGVGLGLALVADIAAHHGGSARCVAASEGRSAFEIQLPLSRPDEED